jgi:hypothetical protein
MKPYFKHKEIPMTAESAAKRQAKIEMQTKLIEGGDLPSCLSCEMWDNKDEACSKYQVRPPIKVIMVGCVDWTFIPF